jgi:hypothetical protein
MSDVCQIYPQLAAVGMAAAFIIGAVAGAMAYRWWTTER